MAKKSSKRAGGFYGEPEKRKVFKGDSRMSENKQDVMLRFKNYKSIYIPTLRKFQVEHPSEIISKLAGRIADRIELKRRLA